MRKAYSRPPSLGRPLLCCCSLCGCLKAFNLRYYNSRHFQRHLNAARATRILATRDVASCPRLPSWDNDKPNMILRQCYYQAGSEGWCTEPLYCVLCLLRRKWHLGWRRRPGVALGLYAMTLTSL